jgi:hypothetical protein
MGPRKDSVGPYERKRDFDKTSEPTPGARRCPTGPRHPRYIGLRHDKPAGKVRRERPKNV